MKGFSHIFIKSCDDEFCTQICNFINIQGVIWHKSIVKSFLFKGNNILVNFIDGFGYWDW